MKRSLPPLLVLCVALLATPASAQDDSVAFKCTQSKLKAASKGCACVHRTWTAAIAHGAVPDFTACDGKLVDAFGKAEQRAIVSGGQCWAGETAQDVAAALVAAADKSVGQSGRGTLTPAPSACDELPRSAEYAGGNYGAMPKCVKPAEGDDCDDDATVRKLKDAITKDVSCPKCPAGEKGCDPSVSWTVSSNVEQRDDACCLKADPTDPKKSKKIIYSCSLCISG